MKILLVNKFHYLKGGSETYYFTLADALRKKGHEVIFFAMQDEKNLPCEQENFFVQHKDYNQQAGIIHQLKNGLNLICSKEAKEKMRLLIEKEKPDLAIFNLVHRQITLSIVEPLKDLNIPIFFTMHDLICACPNYLMLSQNKVCEKCANGNFSNCIRQKCVKNSLPKSVLAVMEAYYYKISHTYHKIDLFITPSAFYKNKLEKTKFTKSLIVHRKNPLPIDTKYEITEQTEDYLFYFGRLSKEKGLITLLKAMKQLSSSNKLLIAGDGPQREELQQFVIENSLENKVCFLGFKSGLELQTLIAKSKCVVLPSEWYENGPYSIMEAMAKGKPVIVSNMGGLPELTEHNITGFIFEVGNVNDLCDKINQLFALNHEQYIQMCKSVMVKAKQDFSPDMYVDFIISEYQKIQNKR